MCWIQHKHLHNSKIDRTQHVVFWVDQDSFSHTRRRNFYTRWFRYFSIGKCFEQKLYKKTNKHCDLVLTYTYTYAHTYILYAVENIYFLPTII